MIYRCKGKISTPHEGIMSGNGTLGVLAFGEDRLSFSVDRADLWDERMPKEFADKNFNYPYLSECLKNNMKEAERLFDGCYNHSYPTKLNAGSIIFSKEVSGEDEFVLNTENAVFTYLSGNEKVRGYVDAYKNVIVAEIPRGYSFEYLPAAYLARPLNERGLDYPQATIYNDGDFFIARQKTYDKNEFGVIVYRKNDGEKSSLYISVYKNRELKKCKKTVVDYAANKEKNYTEHLGFWKNYYATSSVNTCDEGVNELYEKGRYFFGCNSKGNTPMTLQGIWTLNDGNPPPWKSDFHNDVNVQMTYDAYLKTGNYAEGLILVDFLHRNKKAFARFAKRFMKTEGLLIPGVMSRNCSALGGWPQYAMSPAVSIWAIKPFYDVYEHFGDKTFLKKEAYPFFRDTEKCVSRYLSLNDEGYYELDFHSSPEYYENGAESVFSKQTNFELTMLKFLYGTLISFCEELKIDNDRYKKVFEKLAPYYCNDNEELKISEDKDYVFSHRHFSHMLMYKNFGLINPVEEKARLLKDVELLENKGYGNWVGFSFVEAAGLYAYAGDGENAYRHLKIFEDAFVYPNGFHMNFDYKKKGYSNLQGKVLTLEANVGYVRALCDMCLRETCGVITVFPAIPEEFKAKGASFRDLRISGDGKVSALYDGGALSFKIVLKKPKTVKLYNNFKDFPILVVDGSVCECAQRKGEIITVKAEKEIRYETRND